MDDSYQIKRMDVLDLKYPQLSSVDPNARKYNPKILIPSLKWNNKLAEQRVYETIELLGKNPDIYDPKPNGRAVWINPPTFFTTGDSFYSDIVIKDAGYYHEKPVDHLDFYYISLNYRISPDKLSGLHKITGSAYYYLVGELLYAGCHFPSASIVTFNIIKEYNENKISLEDARELYNNRIAQASVEYNKAATSGNIKNPDNWNYIRILEDYITENY